MKKLSAKNKFVLGFSVLVWFILVLSILIYGENVPVLQTGGQIAEEERKLLIFGTLLSLIIVIPVFTLLFVFAWKYRESNNHPDYSPDLDGDKKLEAIWWGVPIILIGILSFITWTSTHRLDPFKEIESDKKPLTIQVVSLDWKWLFLYPEQAVASVNYVQLPVDRPVIFEITSDAPMNSFWVPGLAGQMYSMSGMKTELNILATKTGEYRGSSANISGVGFANMKFVANVGTENEFEQWVMTAKQSMRKLDHKTYAALAVPTEKENVSYYGKVENGLFESIINDYHTPDNEEKSTHTEHVH